MSDRPKGKPRFPLIEGIAATFTTVDVVIITLMVASEATALILKVPYAIFVLVTYLGVGAVLSAPFFVIDSLVLELKAEMRSRNRSIDRAGLNLFDELGESRVRYYLPFLAISLWGASLIKSMLRAFGLFRDD